MTFESQLVGMTTRERKLITYFKSIHCKKRNNPGRLIGQKQLGFNCVSLIQKNQKSALKSDPRLQNRKSLCNCVNLQKTAHKFK